MVFTAGKRRGRWGETRHFGGFPRDVHIKYWRSCCPPVAFEWWCPDSRTPVHI